MTNNRDRDSLAEECRPFGDVEGVKQNLGEKAILGGSSLVVSEIGCNVFRLIGTVVLARLLTPEHFGLISMVTALTVFAEMFKDLGLGTATIQRKEITHEQISTLFWINTGVGAAIMLLLAGTSPIISWFYGDKRLFWISISLSSTFLFGGLTVQHQALLRRQMRFPQLALIQILSTGLSTIIAILLAWRGFEYWALVWKEISRAVIQASGTWLFSHWMPGLPNRGSGVRTMLHTGSHISGYNIVAFASRNLDQVLLGKLWGAGPVGLYKQASMLLSLPGSLFSYPITYVMTPALSALQTNPERYRRYYKLVVSFLAFCYMPVVAYLAVYSETIVAIVLGGKWLAAAPVIRILAFAACIETVASTSGIVMITCGKTKDYLVLGGIQSFVSVVAIVIGVNWGLIGVATAWVGIVYLTVIPSLWYSFKDTPISIRLFFEAIYLPALSSIIMSAVCLLIRYYFRPPDVLTDLVYSLLFGPFLYLAVWMLFPGGKRQLSEFLPGVLRTLDMLPIPLRLRTALIKTRLRWQEDGSEV